MGCGELRKVKIVGLVVFIVLLLLLFFSSTIYTYNIPEVTSVLPKNGRLNKAETAMGVALWSQTVEVYFEIGGKIEEIFVEEGSLVAVGDLLARLSFDAQDAEFRLTQLAIDRDKLQVSVETSNLRIDRLESQIRNLLDEVFDVDEVSDYAIVQLEGRVLKAREGLAKSEENYLLLEELYEVGAIPMQEVASGKSALDNAAYELNSLLLDYENAKRLKADAEEKNEKSVSDREKDRQAKLQEWNYEIETIRRDIRTKNLDIQKNNEEQGSYRRLLQSFEDNIELRAAHAGEVVSLVAKTGQIVNKNQFFASFGLGNTFDIVCSLSLQNNFVVVGDECKISNPDHAFLATVAKISPAEMAKEVTVRVSSDEITAGETFDIEFAKESAKAAVLAPNGAVNMDSDGYFVYYIKKRKGILGDEYYAQRVTVYIGDSDNENTVITGGISFFEPMVLLADKPFSGGDTIKVKNEGEFFVD